MLVTVVTTLCYFSMVSVTEQMDLFELHVCIRDYCFAREDRLVGVAIMRLSDIAEQVGHCITLSFQLVTISFIEI